MRRELLGCIFLTLLFLMGCQTISPTATSKMEKREIHYTTLIPRAHMPGVKLIPLASRPSDLNNKMVYIINSWPAGSEMEDVLAEAAEYLVKRFPTLKVISRNKPSASMTPDPDLWDEMIKKGNAFIYGGAPSWGTTASALTFASGLEKRGLPGVVLVYDTIIDNA